MKGGENVYSNIQLAKVRQRDMLMSSAQLRHARRLRLLSRASRRVERARERLSQAQRKARRVSELDVSWG
jgi:hypothetical protein